MAVEITNTSKVVRGVSSQTLVTLVLGLVEIVSFSIMSRLLTQEDFGYYAAITAVTFVFATFSETGIGSAIVQQKELSASYINNAFTISLIFGSIMSLILLMSAGVLARLVADESMSAPLMMMSGTLLLNCLTSVNLSIMHRKLQFLRMGLINLISLVVTSCVAIWLAYKGFGYYAIITKAIMCAVLTFFLSFLMCNTRYGFAFDIQIIKRIFSFSGWLMASSLFRNLSHQVDRLLMPRLLSVTALGAYNRPKDFIEQISNKLNGIFDIVLFPVLSGIQDNRQALNYAFRRSMSLMNVFSLLMAMAFMFNSGLLIRIFFGEQWINLKPVFFVLSCSMLFNINGRLADCYLRSMAMTKQQFYFRVFEFVLNTAGVIIGYKGGILSVAISVMTTSTIAKLIKIVYIGRKVDVTSLGVIGIIFTSWRFALIVMPVCIIAYTMLPNTLNGDIIMIVLFVLLVIMVFLFIPHFVGDYYYEEVYVKLKSIVEYKFNRK